MTPHINAFNSFFPSTTFIMNSQNTAQSIAVAQQGSCTDVTALISVEARSIRWALGGVAPTYTLGHLAEKDDVIELEGWREIETFQFISNTAGSVATLQITIGFDRLRSG